MVIFSSFRMIPIAALFLTSYVGNGWAQSPAEPDETVTKAPNLKLLPRGDLAWKLSIGALAAANSLDTASSWGKCEQNGILAGPDGRFGVRGELVKAGLVGGLIAAEWLVTRRTPRATKVFSFLNFGAAAGIGALAVRNFGIPAPTGTERCH